MQGLDQVLGMLFGLELEHELLDKASQHWQKAALLQVIMEQPAVASSICMVRETCHKNDQRTNKRQRHYLRCSLSAAFLSASWPVL